MAVIHCYSSACRSLCLLKPRSHPVPMHWCQRCRTLWISVFQILDMKCFSKLMRSHWTCLLPVCCQFWHGWGWRCRSGWRLRGQWTLFCSLCNQLKVYCGTLQLIPVWSSLKTQCDFRFSTFLSFDHLDLGNINLQYHLFIVFLTSIKLY